METKLSGDGVYSVSLPITIDVKFYIRAQNNDAMMLSPEKQNMNFMNILLYLI